MRVGFQPLVLVTGGAGLALGQYRAVAAKSSGGSGSSGDKKQMSCDEALDQASIAIGVGTLFLTMRQASLASMCFGYATGLMNASCKKEQSK
jgi:hypothetical protein